MNFVKPLLLGFGILSFPISAQELEPELIIHHVPPTGEVHTASVGTKIHEYSRTYSFNATVTDEDMRGGQFLIPLTVKAGTAMFPVSTKTEHKACVPNGPCGLDYDGDGTFDRMAADEIKTALKLKKPISYRTERITVESPENLRQIIIFTGATNETLRFSYREFSNNMARPAFTEELTIPSGSDFPQDIAVKRLKFRIHSVDGLGLRYEVLP